MGVWAYTLDVRTYNTFECLNLTVCFGHLNLHRGASELILWVYRILRAAGRRRPVEVAALAGAQRQQFPNSSSHSVPWTMTRSKQQSCSRGSPDVYIICTHDVQWKGGVSGNSFFSSGVTVHRNLRAKSGNAECHWVVQAPAYKELYHRSESLRSLLQLESFICRLGKLPSAPSPTAKLKCNDCAQQLLRHRRVISNSDWKPSRMIVSSELGQPRDAP